MKQSDYYLYIVPQTGKVYKVRDFSRRIEMILCKKYGRIFAISGYSKAAKIVTRVLNDEYNEYTTHSCKELVLDRDVQLEDWEREVLPDPPEEITLEDIEEGIRCSNLK